MITNFKQLAISPLRRDALRIINAGYEAVDIKHLVGRKFRRRGKAVCIEDAKKICRYVDLDAFERVFAVGIGKGSALASATLAHILGKRLTGGITLDVVPLNVKSSKLEDYVGTHPFPSPQNVRATQKIIKLAKSLTEKDLIFFFICGGGSALAVGTAAELESVHRVTRVLTAAGADIIELNTVRKHLSDVKGGGLAKLCYPATVIALIASDVLGNNSAFVASGPTIKDKTTKKDAEKILRKYHLDGNNFSLRETPKDQRYFKKTKNILLASNRDAVEGMRKAAQKLGFKTKVETLTLRGEARTALLPFVKNIRPGEAIIAAGETTVRLGNQVSSIKYQAGKGGRNQESVLGALNTLYHIPNTLVASFASDAHDNTEAAGAIGDKQVLVEASKRKIETKSYLDRHDSFHFFQKTGSLIFAERSSFNVADLMLVVKSKR